MSSASATAGTVAGVAAKALPSTVTIEAESTSGEGGTGAAPLEFTDHVGSPMQEGLLLVHNTLRGAGLREKIKIGCAGKVVSAFDIARLMALGADWCNSARGFMFALGCLQAQTCHTGHCPTGVATQDSLRQQALVVPDKAERVYHFHQQTLHALQELVQADRLGRRVIQADMDSDAVVELAEDDLISDKPSFVAMFDSGEAAADYAVLRQELLEIRALLTV